MRIAIVGGYGVFGSRLAELLIRDGHDVWIAGRNIDKANKQAQRLGAIALSIDRTGDLESLFAVEPDLVVDAAGPFQTYGSEPYRLASACIAHSTDYADLADDAAFVAGIYTLDPKAKQAGCRLISGASSVPGLSSAAVTAFAEGLDEVEAISSAILPGNRPPRGLSVIASIVSQAGAPMRIWRGSEWLDVPTWSGRKLHTLTGVGTRAAHRITVPDLWLFPTAFGANTVEFRAGLELGVMNRALAVLASLRRWRLWRPS